MPDALDKSLSETALRKYLMDGMRGFGHVFPVESHLVTPGVPDYGYTIRGYNGWLELKRGSKSKPPELRLSQKLWLEDNVKHQGDPLILCCIDHDSGNRTLGLIHGDRAGLVYCRPAGAWLDAMGAVWENEISWPQFVRQLAFPRSLRGDITI